MCKITLKKFMFTLNLTSDVCKQSVMIRPKNIFVVVKSQNQDDQNHKLGEISNEPNLKTFDNVFDNVITVSDSGM